MLRPPTMVGATPSTDAASAAPESVPAQRYDRQALVTTHGPHTSNRRRPPRLSTLLVTAAMSTAAFVALSLLVARGITQNLDDAVRQWFRPNDVWGIYQLIFGNVVDGIAPPIAVAILGIATIVAAWRDRSIRPMVFAGLTASVAMLLTVAGKAISQRPDPHGGLWHGGAYPSGHMVMLLVALGCALLMLRPRARWWEWLGVALVGLTMAVSLLFLAMHWFTDVVAGTLIGITLLAVVSIPGVARASRRRM